MSSRYFNNAFSKRPLQEVIQAMEPYWREVYQNPLTESEGAEKTRNVVAQSRYAVASLIGASPEEIFFVSSGTEANNWALKGPALARREGHMIISAVEHFSVFQAAQYLQGQGIDLSILPVNRDGLVDPSDLQKEIRPSTFLVSVQASSDEIGVIQNLRTIAEFKQQYPNILFHTDAIQYLCYESLDLNKIPLDLVSLSSNALYGPSGVAALYIRSGIRTVPMFHGGMQEDGYRPGLQSIPLIAGFGKAAALNAASKEQWKSRLGSLQEQAFQALRKEGISVTGSWLCRAVDNIHIILDVDSEAVLTLLSEDGIECSSGSTCYQYAMKESHVLSALGIPSSKARGALLFTLSLEHEPSDVRFLTERIKALNQHFGRLKPA